MTECKNCTSKGTGNYCSNCGHKFKLERIDGHYIKHEIGHLLHVEKGIFYTVKELIIRPGKNIRDFFFVNREQLVKPIVYLIVTSLIYSLIAHFFHIESYENYITEDDTSTSSKIFKWGDEHSGYANLIMGIFIAFWTKLFFRKKNFNLYEILILLCFITGTSMIIFSIFTFLQGILHFNLQLVSGVTGILYSTWAISDFFGRTETVNYVKSLLSYALGLFTFALSVVIIGTLIDLMIQ